MRYRTQPQGLQGCSTSIAAGSPNEHCRTREADSSVLGPLLWLPSASGPVGLGSPLASSGLRRFQTAELAVRLVIGSARSPNKHVHGVRTGKFSGRRGSLRHCVGRSAPMAWGSADNGLGPARLPFLRQRRGRRGCLAPGSGAPRNLLESTLCRNIPKPCKTPSFGLQSPSQDSHLGVSPWPSGQGARPGNPSRSKCGL